MNFFGAFQSEVFKPLVTLLIPGALAVSSWFVALCWKFPSVSTLVTNNRTESSWILLFVTIAAGLVIEDWGARIESDLDEKAEKETKGDHFRNWYAYLRTCFESDPVGRRYARALVLRLKFELGMVVALIVVSGGLLWLLTLGLHCATGLILLTASLGMSFLQFAEAKRTHEVLAGNRAELLKPIRVVNERNVQPPL